jgi:hypothetical protein
LPLPKIVARHYTYRTLPAVINGIMKNEFVLCNAARCRFPKVQVDRPLSGLKLGIQAQVVIIVCISKEINKNLLHFHGT